jgi:hypothetical protein
MGKMHYPYCIADVECYSDSPRNFKKRYFSHAYAINILKILFKTNLLKPFSSLSFVSHEMRQSTVSPCQLLLY